MSTDDMGAMMAKPGPGNPLSREARRTVRERKREALERRVAKERAALWLKPWELAPSEVDDGPSLGRRASGTRRGTRRRSNGARSWRAIRTISMIDSSKPWDFVWFMRRTFNTNRWQREYARFERLAMEGQRRRAGGDLYGHHIREREAKWQKLLGEWHDEAREEDLRRSKARS